jgi:hypothetical protein
MSEKRYVVISTNDNKDYFEYIPYQEKAWKRFGWDLIIMVTPDFNPINFDIKLPTTMVCQLPRINEIRSQTLAQMGRLYAAHYIGGNPLLMTCDMDLIPLSDYWNPDPNKITVYGHDLTDKTYYPMGYVAMNAENWRHKLQITSDTGTDILRDCGRTIIKGEMAAYSDNWEIWWNTDWRLLTDRLTPYRDEITFIDRGRRTVSPNKGVFAFGRVDRGDSMQVPAEKLIDMHCENNNVKHPDKWNRFLSIYESVHGKLEL